MIHSGNCQIVHSRVRYGEMCKLEGPDFKLCSHVKNVDYILIRSTKKILTMKTLNQVCISVSSLSLPVEKESNLERIKTSTRESDQLGSQSNNSGDMMKGVAWIMNRKM